jgi:hypothetical protein
MATEQEAAEAAQQEIDATDQGQEAEQAYTPADESAEHKQESPKLRNSLNNHGDRSNFVHGLSVGLGIGCIATFVIIWISVFFTPQLPEAITYENMLAVFVYPLIYLLAVGLVSLTAGIVREYYARH